MNLLVSVKIHLIIKKIYEDNATGRLTNERFDRMYTDYEAELATFESKIMDNYNNYSVILQFR